ncbi:MAG: TetR/AcrR family transcriptional regulator [Acidimicrobiales bacterium]
MAATQARTRAASLPPEERRRTIVDAAIPLVVEHGEMVATRHVADAAGIAEGTLFRVFPDKESLLAAVIERVLDPEPLEQALAAIDAERPLTEVVTAAVQASQRRGEDVWRVVSRIGKRSEDQPRRPMPESPALTRLLEAHRDELTVAPTVAARNLRALTLAMSHPLLVERPASPKEIARMFLHGVAKDLSAKGRSC